MNAREYADRYKTNPHIPTLNAIVKDFVLETQTLVLQRKAQSDSDELYRIIDELDAKWRKFVELTKANGISPDVFKRCIERASINVYLGWQQYKEPL